MIEVNVDNIVLETKHLILRAFRADDLSDFNAYASDPGVGEMAGWTHHKDLAESQRILEILMAEKKAFALELKATSQVIGSLGIEYLPAVMPQAFHGLVGAHSDMCSAGNGGEEDWCRKQSMSSSNTVLTIWISIF
jgi:ribosomal-protein-alanine N-acetyltransferase